MSSITSLVTWIEKPTQYHSHVGENLVKPYKNSFLYSYFIKYITSVAISIFYCFWPPWSSHGVTHRGLYRSMQPRFCGNDIEYQKNRNYSLGNNTCTNSVLDRSAATFTITSCSVTLDT